MYNYYSTPSYSTYDYDTLDAAGSVSEGVAVWTAIAAILAIIGGILVYFLFVKSKNSPKSRFMNWLKDFLSFKIFWLEPILKVVYYIATIFIILFSFTFLPLGGYGVLAFFICLIGGPVFIRLVYEMTMMFIMIWRNTRDIADNTTKTEGKSTAKATKK